MTAIEESPKQVSLRRILPPVVTGQEVVLFIVIAVLLPIFEMNQLIK